MTTLPASHLSADSPSQARAGLLQIIWETVERQPLLLRDAKCMQTLQALKRSLKRTDFKLLGFVILPERLQVLAVPTSRYSDVSQLAADFPRCFEKTSSHSMSPGKITWQLEQTRCTSVEPALWKELLDKMHGKPVLRGLAGQPGEWKWSSYRYHRGLAGEPTFDDLLVTHGFRATILKNV